MALEESPNFVGWCDSESDGFMFTAKQEESWTINHLKLCLWYVEMPKDETPLHEEQNSRAADPSFSWSNVVAASQAANADSAPARGSTGTLKPSAKGSSTKGPEPKTKAALKGTKQGSVASGREVSKRGKVNVGTGECDDVAPVQAGTDISEAKSSKSNSQNRSSHGLPFTQGVRQTLAIRGLSSKPVESLILNECFTDFISVEKSSSREKFERFARKVWHFPKTLLC